MQRASIWVLPFLILAVVACGQRSGEGETPASETATTQQKYEDPDPIANPRNPKEVWPLVLVQRDKVRKMMAKDDIWHDDLDKLEADLMLLLRLVGEVADWVRLNPAPDVDYKAVARSRGDVRVAAAPIRSAIQAKAPGMWIKLAPGIDDALHLMEKRFPDGLGESVADRPDYAKHVFETS